MDKILSIDEARALTAPFHRGWVESHEHALKLLNDGRKANPELFAPLETGDYCTFAHRLIYAQAAKKADPRLISTTKLGFNAQIVEGRGLVRFKHLNRSYAPCAYPTTQQRHLNNQEYTEEMWEQLLLDGVVKPPTVLNVGYRTSHAWDKLERVVVACWYRGKLVYSYPIDEAATGRGDDGGADILPLPSTPPIAPRIVSKRKSKKPEDGGAE